MHLAHPIWLLLMVPVLIAAWRMLARRIRKGLRFASVERLTHPSPSLRIRILVLLPWLFCLSLFLLVLAMARPRRELTSFRREADAISIQMVVDVSGSMEALDLSRETPDGIEYLTRLDVVKDVFAQFVALRPDDKIGLISFGGFASSLAPLTLDHAALMEILADLEIPRPIQDPSSGDILNAEERMTAIGDALALACVRLRDAETASRIIVLLSDGDSNAGVLDPMEAVEIALALGFRVYTIGVGSTGYAPVRVTDGAGRQHIRNAWISFDESALIEIAERTGGQYFSALDEEGLMRAIESINELETTLVSQQILERHAEYFRWFLLPALILLLLSTSLSALWNHRLI